jgi:multiple sugar transport system substrate-binding protein
MVMYYNEELFDAYSVPYPQAGWTWDDFLATASSLRDPGSEVFGYGPMDEIFDPLVFIYQHGGGIFDDLQNPSRVTLDEPANVEALEFYVRLLLDYDVAPTPEQARDAFGAGGGSIQTGVFLGQVGMWSGMLSERGGLSWPAEWTMEWGMVSLPRDRRAATLTLVEGYFISSQAESSDACWAWVSFLSHQLPVARAPVRRSLAESDAYSQQVGDEVASVVRSSLADVLLLSPELADYEQALGAFGRALQAIMEGRATPEDALSQAQQRIQGQ